MARPARKAHREFRGQRDCPDQRARPAKLDLQDRLVPPAPRQRGPPTSCRGVTWPWANSLRDRRLRSAA